MPKHNSATPCQSIPMHCSAIAKQNVALPLRHETRHNPHTTPISDAVTSPCSALPCGTLLCFRFVSPFIALPTLSYARLHLSYAVRRCAFTSPSYTSLCHRNAYRTLPMLCPNILHFAIALLHLANALLRCTMPIRGVASLYIRRTPRSLTATTPCIASPCHALTTLSDTPPPPRSTCRTLATPD